MVGANSGRTPHHSRRAIASAIGLRYLPAIARRLLHCRDPETGAPFDFLGFLDFAPADEPAFEDMLGQLRSTKEWSFMEREIDIHLVKDTR
ncbi:hypothetical protein [Rhizobium sp. BK661]|uniref:hypothetical protein n=1 Tax=Rhizobium sp. BK661 TaxID=2586991 RepID=UPI00216A5BE0|nr:hypothetical protein [Rhizobium sp. BK661]MCS3743300.1 hypothetical protein [Rhizobium sp. BK661]